MSKQYFENNPDLVSEPFTFTYYFKKNLLTFKSDNGVFSKKGVDFGSSLLLQSIEINENEYVLDVGCGIGIMGITIAKSNPSCCVDMVDVNLRAIKLTNENCIQNKVENAKAFESYAYSNITKVYDVIVTNPPIRAGKKVVYDIILGSYDHLKEEGRMYCVIQKKQGAESSIKALKNVFPIVEVINKDNGYFIIKCIKK